MKKAFTLIELLVVISIIGVLTTLIVANFSDARVRARDTRRKQELNQLKTALRLYYNDNQAYPVNAAGIGATGAVFQSGTTIYMKKLPDEFAYTANGTDGFFLTVNLENASDADLTPSHNTCPGHTYGTDEFALCED
jgi:prepilin-type N-terminal cleavage/methylation domain-containing protein